MSSPHTDLPLFVMRIVSNLDHDQLSALRYRGMELLEDLDKTAEERNEASRATLLEVLSDCVKHYGA